MPVAITNENLTTEIEQSDKPVILDVYAPWCGPCQQMAPIFEELEGELGATYKFAKLNVDEAREASIQFGVASIPTFVFIKNGTMVGKQTGYMSKDKLKELIEKYFG